MGTGEGGAAAWDDVPPSGLPGHAVRSGMAKKKRKRRARAKSKANHGKRPNT
ncbi:MAG TPA: hypothetical protein VKP11_00650 [Frankiaceae bacterium]|nr:hypothetical protein [Frankiaceae bacterium]